MPKTGAISHMRLFSVGLVLMGFTTASACAKLAGIEGAQRDENQTISTGGTQSEDGGTADVSCSGYCDSVMEYCTDKNDQYTTRELCMGTCKQLPLGTKADTLVDTRWCRFNQASVAEALGGGTEAASNCLAAGPGGNGVCGTNCASYCLLMQRICLPQWNANFVDAQDCLDKCAALPSLGAFDAAEAVAVGGNNINCRLYHLSAASVSPSIHCPHAAGAAPCQ
jgi:hypothetical protein